MTTKTKPDIEQTFLISKDLRKAAATLSKIEVRFLVDFYYQAQKDRIRTGNQIRAASEAEEPHAVLAWFFGKAEDIEKSLKGALSTYAKSNDLGQWCLSIHGIGPVITAGLMAHIDITKAPTVGHIWRFAGLDPTARWKAGERRPWNASLKRLCWIIGGSFVKLRSSPNDIYGKVYEQRKVYEQANNEAGNYAELAKRTIEEKRIRDKATRSRYEEGKLPDGRIENRARRYATKLFLSHYHHVAYEIEFGRIPPKPYIIEHGGHVDFIAPPKWR